LRTDTASVAGVKKLYLIDLDGATEITNMAKVDLGSASNTGIDAHLIPCEGRCPQQERLEWTS
jgi:hypothetical protein